MKILIWSILSIGFTVAVASAEPVSRGAYQATEAIDILRFNKVFYVDGINLMALRLQITHSDFSEDVVSPEAAIHQVLSELKIQDEGISKSIVSQARNLSQEAKGSYGHGG